MRRVTILRTATAILFAALFASTAVAWAQEVLRAYRAGNQLLIPSPPPPVLPPGFNTRPYYPYSSRYTEPEPSLADIPVAPRRFAECYGFPFPCLQYFYTYSTHQTDANHFNYSWSAPVMLRDPRWRFRFPLCPAFPGFLYNNLIYAALFTPLLAFRPLRRYVRLRRGYCPSCGYNVAHDFIHPCPECGRTASNHFNPATCPDIPAVVGTEDGLSSARLRG